MSIRLCKATTTAELPTYFVRLNFSCHKYTLYNPIIYCCIASQLHNTCKYAQDAFAPFRILRGPTTSAVRVAAPRRTHKQFGGSTRHHDTVEHHDQGFNRRDGSANRAETDISTTSCTIITTSRTDTRPVSSLTICAMHFDLLLLTFSEKRRSLADPKYSPSFRRQRASRACEVRDFWCLYILVSMDEGKVVVELGDICRVDFQSDLGAEAMRYHQC